jgi:hypothetical protein
VYNGNSGGKGLGGMEHDYYKCKEKTKWGAGGGGEGFQQISSCSHTRNFLDFLRNSEKLMGILSTYLPQTGRAFSLHGLIRKYHMKRGKNVQAGTRIYFKLRRHE